MYSDPLSLSLDDILCEPDEMPNNLVRGIGSIIKVHVDMADASL
jgi:hypothetical protein